MRSAVAHLVTLLVAMRLAAPFVAPGVLPADAGEFQLVARDLGVAHPPGYALYTMAAHVFARIASAPAIAPLLGADGGPLATPGCCSDTWAWAVNLFSAALAAVTLWLVYRSGRLAGQSHAAGILAATVLAGSPTFVAQATTANIRMPTAMFAALLIFLTVRHLSRTNRQSASATHLRWTPVGLSFVLGLAVTHHLSLAALALPIVIVIILDEPELVADLRTVAACGIGIVLALLPLHYLPIRDRAGATLAPGNLTTARGLVEHVTGYGFRGDAFYIDDPALLTDRIVVLVNIAELQFGWLALLLAAVGATWFLLRRRYVGILLASTVALLLGLTVTYRAPQTMEYLLPTYVAVALLASGVVPGAAALAARLRTRLGDPLAAWRWIAPGLALLLSLAIVVDRWRLPSQVREAHADLAGAISVLEHGCAPPDATVLASWHYFTPLRYAAKFLTPRPDLTITYVHPEGAEPIGATWARHAAAESGRAVLTNRPREVRQSGIALWPVAESPFYSTRSSLCADRLEWEEVPGDELYGGILRLESTARDEVNPQGLPLYLSFEGVSPVSETLTASVQLHDTSRDSLVGQVDHSHPPERWNNERGLVDRFSLLPYRGQLGGPMTIAAYVYRTIPGGTERLPFGASDGATIGQLAASDLEPLARAAPVAGMVPFGLAMTLLGSDVEHTHGQLVVDLEWLAEEAYVSDYTVSVQAHGTGWRAQHDGTPALGAIPTLKWLPGMVIGDRHRIELPGEVTFSTEFFVTVSVYDSFDMEPLPVTDAELARRGQGQSVTIYRSGP